MEFSRRFAIWLLVWMLVIPADMARAVIASSPGATRDAMNAPVLEEIQELPCDAPGANKVLCENLLPGVEREEWDLPNQDAGDPAIQGFATDISVNLGEMVQFKIDSTTPNYRIDIYRLGYYQGLGARRLATIAPLANVPHEQPNCLTVTATGLIDCGNWAVSASWIVPAQAVSGVYVAKLVQTASGAASHIVFVVRDDNGGSDLLFQTSDTTWQAYNDYAGSSLYRGVPAGRAYKVSYNRPLITRGDPGAGRSSAVFNAEYPMIRWLEANGYDVSYTSGVDTDRHGAELLEHKVFLSVGHDEYWSKTQRANVEAARDAGVNLAFFSGNEVFWKTRWETSIDGSGTPYRTLVCYKETHANQKIDPSPEWTGTWRDPRFSPPSDGGRPENALTGTLFTVNGSRADSIMVPASFGRHRFWRNTSIAQLAEGQTKILPAGTLGYEWNEAPDNGFQPAGLQRLSSTTLDVWPLYLQDYGSNYGLGTATHSLTLYRAQSGALVFGAGTVQWSWGLDAEHDRAGTQTSLDMQQATVNLLADMGVYTGGLQAGLVSGEQAFVDTSAPVSTIATPPSGAVVQSGDPVVISGSASDNVALAGVEVSVDAGASWHQATGLENWTYSWTPSASGAVTIMSRAFDDSGNMQLAASSVTVTVARECPCTIWGDTVVPPVTAHDDFDATEVGVRFAADTDGLITGLRFYKGPGNNGTHTGTLWSADGEVLARAVFTNETATGWQQVNFERAVSITAGVAYVASYYAPMGRYAIARPSTADPTGGFAAAVNNPPLRALADNEAGGNGLFIYSSAPAFPVNSFGSTNYFVDVVFLPAASIDTTSPFVTARTPLHAATGVTPFTNVTARFSEPLDPESVTAQTAGLTGPSGAIPGTVSYLPSSRTIVFDPAERLADNTVYVARIRGGPSGVRDLNGILLGGDVIWSFTTAAAVACPCTLWTPETVPTSLVNNADDARAVQEGIELGLRFRADNDGYISGIRFYKTLANSAPHTASLWTDDGVQLAHAAFVNETPSGWQQVTFPTPIFIRANQTYVASYHTSVGRYSVNRTYFLSQFSSAFVRPPLRAVSDEDGGANGVFAYGPHQFPTDTFMQSNYWVDVVFDPAAGADAAGPLVTALTPQDGANEVQADALVTASFNESIDPETVTTATFELRETASGALVPSTVALNAAALRATLDPAAPLSELASYTATIRGGLNGVRDAAGNPLAADVSWTFTTAGALVCPCTIWPDTVTPGLVIDNIDDTDAIAQGIELGVRFRADRDGQINGIRFYKAAGNTGPHSGTLWSSSGTELATATLDAGGASGWQQITFSTPVRITAGSTYVASYHAPAGHYSVDAGYFVASNAANYTRGPLAALVSGGDTPNGVFRYGPRAFPSGSFNHSNYWVDVVFDELAVVNAAPVASADSYTVNEGAVLSVNAPGVLANDSDADDTSLTAVLVSGPAAGTLAFTGSGSFTYTPNAGFTGVDSFVYSAYDGAAGSNHATVTITVAAVNHAPIASAQSVTTPEDTAVAIVLTGADPDGDAVTFTIATPPVHGTLTGTAPALTYTPAPNYHGPDSFTFIVNDGALDSNAGTVTLNVDPVNDLPVTGADARSTGEDTSLTILAAELTSNDTDLDGDTLTVTAVNGAAKGAVVLAGGSITYTPNLNVNGSDAFTYTVADGHGGTATGTVNVVITPANDGPIAVADSKSTSEDTPLVFLAAELTSNDTDVDGDTLTVTAVNGAAKGTVVLAGGSITYTPSLNVNGSDGFTYTVTDGHGGTATGTVNITIEAANDAPVIAPIGSKSVAEGASVTINVAATDPDDGTLTYTAGPLPAGASFVGTAFAWTPTFDQSGDYPVTFTVTDGTAVARETITIRVTNTNRAPVLAPIGGKTVAEGMPLSFVVTAADADGQPVTLSASALPAGAVFDGPTGAFSWMPSYVQAGSYDVTFTATDGTDSVSEKIAIVVVNVNRAPALAAIGSRSVAVGSSLTFRVSAQDPDPGATLTYTTSALPAGALFDAATATFTWTPTVDQEGLVEVTFNVSDGSLGDSESITIAVGADNAAADVSAGGTLSTEGDGLPGASAIHPVETSVTLPAGVVGFVSIAEALSTDVPPAGYAFLGHDVDIVAPAATVAQPLLLTFLFDVSLAPLDADISLIEIVRNGVAVANCSANAGTSATPNPCVASRTRLQDGDVQIVVRTSHASRWRAQRPTNRAPVASNQSVTATSGAPTPVTVVATDQDGDAVTFSLVAGPSHGAVSQAGATFTYTASAGYSGGDSFTFKASDGKADSNVATVSLTVLAGTTTTLSSSAAGTSPTYGTAVTLTAAVTLSGTSAAAASGIVDFFDDGVLLGSDAVDAAGRATLTTTAIQAGTRTLTASYRGVSTLAASTSNPVAQTITKGTATGTFVTLSPIQKQYSDRVLMEATVAPATAADSVTFQIGTQILATVPVVNGKASSQVQVMGAPGSRIVTAVFNSPNYTVANRSKSMSILKEDARVAYTGSNGETLCLCGQTTVPITVKVSDITAVDSATDPDAGDIGTATVSFVNRTTLATMATVTVTPDVDRRTGTATYRFPASALGTAASTTLTFGFVVSGNYNRNNAADNVTITIKK